jgi:phosphate starvation-inducible PhoH-like protein
MVTVKRQVIKFEDNTLLSQLYGEGDKNLIKIEKKLDVSLASRGEQVSISGAEQKVVAAKEVLRRMYKQLKSKREVSDADIDALIRMLDAPATKAKKVTSIRKKDAAMKEVSNIKSFGNMVIKTEKKHITPYSLVQGDYMEALMTREVVFAAGPAGTGKTYIAVAAAVSKFNSGEVERIILSRPAVEAGEKLGFLPGDLQSKIDPYLRPLYDALYDMMPAEKVAGLIENGVIEVAPLAFMRGRTLRNAYVILDEAQNTTPVQMKMFLTRLGEGSHMAITGDLSQTDLPSGLVSGFRDALEKLRDIEEVDIVRFGGTDVVRHELTTKIVAAYERFEKGGDV